MILIDFNQVLIANLMQQIKADPNSEINEGLIRHSVLNTLRKYIKQFRSSFGTPVLACDSSSSWRRVVFPDYKQNRKAAREESSLDWNLIFQSLNKIREELKDNFPYKVIEVPGAEADDIIAVLAEAFAKEENVLILSSDKDFMQLQRFPGVMQYSPYHNKFISTDDPEKFIVEHIIRGDKVDNIPNFLSPDDVFSTSARQKSINSKKLSVWLEQTRPEDFCDTAEMLRGYMRNKTLIDFRCIPHDIKESILQEYENKEVATKLDLLEYFQKNRLKTLFGVVDEF